MGTLSIVLYIIMDILIIGLIMYITLYFKNKKHINKLTTIETILSKNTEVFHNEEIKQLIPRNEELSINRIPITNNPVFLKDVTNYSHNKNTEYSNNVDYINDICHANNVFTPDIIKRQEDSLSQILNNQINNNF